jgi:hypothetical protein
VLYHLSHRNDAGDEMQGRFELVRAGFGRISSLVAIATFATAAAAQSPPTNTAPGEPPPMRELMRAPVPLTPPAAGPTCESARVSAPDNQCSAYYIQTLGSGANAQARVQLDCNWEDRIFEDEIIRVWTGDGVAMRWVDATTLELNLPPEVHFSPPPAQTGHFGHTVHVTYRHVPGTEARPLQCLGPAPNYFKARVLNGPERRRANAPGWVAYEMDGSCLLIGASPVGAGRSEIIVTSFQKDSVARLPLGTTDMVLSVTVPHAGGAPQIRFTSQDARPIPGSNGQYRLIGAEAQRILQRLAQGDGAQVSFTTPDAEAVSVELTREAFAEAQQAFQNCVQTSSRQPAK